MKKLFLYAAAVVWTFSAAQAGEGRFEIQGDAKALYGYTDIKKHHHGIGRGALYSSYVYETEGSAKLSLNADLFFGINREMQTYTQGRWGEEVYGIAETEKFGQLMVGQVANVAALFHHGAPSAGALENTTDIADFLANPDWKRTKKQTYFATLNSTEINTDGVAAKANYISPEVYGTAVGVSYMPKSYSRAGLINKHAAYAHDDGFVGAVYNDHDFGAFSTQTSFGYGQYHGNDKEFSYALRLSRGNWSLGGGWRKTYIDGDDKTSNRAELPLLFDGYREGRVWTVGAGYEIGPVKSALSYFESASKSKENKAKIVAFSNEYQVNRHVNLYGAALYGAYRASEDKVDGYALVVGMGAKF